MDQNKKQKRLSQIIKSQFLKRAVTKLILSVSVFSLFFSHSTLLSLVHYFNFYFSTLPFKLFSHTLDKNCTFLLCNGLLVFLAKYSGLFSLSSSNKYNYNLNDHNESFKNYEDDSQNQMTIMETTHHHHHQQVPLLEQEAELENTQTQQKQNAMQQENENKESEEETHEEQDAENSTEETREEQEEAVLEEDKAEAESSFFIEEVDDEEEEEEEDGNRKLSNEELNKKFDDFIRKMKEELRIEARQQLIMV